MEQIATTAANNCQPSNFYYYNSDGSKHEANFKSPTKRSFLNECIRQIYILNGKAHIPVAPSPIEFDKNQILHMLNVLLVPPTIARDHRSSLDRVKRQLFRETKRKARKPINPQKITSQQMQLQYFKAVRMVLGVKKLRRHYMEEPLHQSKRKLTFSDTEDIALNKSQRGEENNWQQHQPNQAKVCKYLKNGRNDKDENRQNRRLKKLHHQMMEEQYRNQLYINERMLEESLRSIFYMKALLNLVVDQEENLYI